MGIVRQIKCDLCGELVDSEEAVTVMVGKRELRPHDYEVLDIGPECCGGRFVSEILEHAQNAVADVTGADRVEVPS